MVCFKYKDTVSAASSNFLSCKNCVTMFFESTRNKRWSVRDHASTLCSMAQDPIVVWVIRT